jgi:hypothetical protein
VIQIRQLGWSIEEQYNPWLRKHVPRVANRHIIG